MVHNPRLHVDGAQLAGHRASGQAMRIVVVSMAVIAVLVAGAVAFLFSGAYNVAATAPHWRVTSLLMETARERSIRAHGAAVTPPPGLDNDREILTGMAHYRENCAECHGAPGQGSGELAQGLYPKPPELARASPRWSAGELFWIVKNGIKMSGMPAWAPTHDDNELWSIVAFLRHLPAITPDQYRNMADAVAAAGDHHHAPDNPAGSRAAEPLRAPPGEGVPQHSHGTESRR